MGLLRNFLAATVGAKAYQNVFNKPIITAPPGYVVRGLEQKGLGAKWVVTYSKTEALNVTSRFTVNGTSVNFVKIGRAKFHVDWP